MPSVCRWLFRHVLSSAGLSSSCSSSGVFPRGPSLGDLLLLCVQPCPVPGSPPRRSAVSAASSRLPALEPFRESLGQASSWEGKGAQDGACEAGVGTGRHAEVATRLGPTGFPAAGPGEAGRKAALARGVAGPGCCCARRIERRRRGRAASSSRPPLFTPIASNAQSLTERVTSLRKAGFVLFALETARRFGENTVPVFTANVQTYCFPFETGSRETDLETPLSSGHSTSG